MQRLLPVLSAMVMIVLLALAIGYMPESQANAARSLAPDVTLFSDNMESGINGWTVSHQAVGGGTCSSDEWHQGTTDSHSASHAWTNSPYSAAITGNCLNFLTTPAIVTPGNILGLTLSFWNHIYTEG